MGYKCIHRTEINPEKWQNCINSSGQYHLYNQFWYLDIVCGKHWQALIWDDYRAVFPLPISGKLGLQFLQNPNLLQQIKFCGDVCQQDIEELKMFIQSKYKFIALSTSSDVFEGKSKPRCNLTLDIDTYLRTKRSSTLRNNLKRADKHQLKLQIDHDYKEGLLFLKQHFHLTGMVPTDAEWVFYEKVMKAAYSEGKAKFMFVLKDDQPVQFAFWIMVESVAYYLLNISNEKGRQYGASHFAIDAFIRQHENRINLVDFEGSSIEGVKRFYKSFGATETPYYLYYRNTLPFFLKWFKK